MNRRNFIHKSSMTLGGISLVSQFAQCQATHQPLKAVAKTDRLPREVWVASLTQQGIAGDSLEQVIQSAIRKMEMVSSYKPDIICLPEFFHVQGLRNKKLSVEEASEEPIGKITQPLADFARQQQCYVIAPVFTKEDNTCYNAAVLIDRSGKMVGEYRKARPTESEIADGIAPGHFDPPVFETDFGKIGIQICFDIEWLDGWQRLKQKGAEIVFWPSAFAGGKKVNTMAWWHKFHVVSSTQKNTTKICKPSGEEIAWSGNYSQWGVCAPLNLEQAVLHSWPYSLKFPEIHKKYGNKVYTYTLHEEELSFIESRHPDVRIADVLREFEIPTYDQFKHSAELAQQKHRSL
ncbi:carbon-nitrogen hydrolase family protein [Catalinimonas niigatensis]|uniref:carbon-nitrogen hydrolase family protein n=1 Tax=Catalinimonas niigatensis TaxID=1397264 RepID=UPI002666D7DC|nr:carbon-nitrogen hydrolase family protein [Catalinimonas niigatensis]WPP48235.1 carbon-nitrogen hydrolase family protein [Catalinimonas niigatensis]